METQLKITTEQLDDIPLLLGHLDKMEVAELLDAYFPRHGNWSGVSLGNVVCIWLAHILSEGDHYLDHVRPWVASKTKSLRHLVDADVGELDFTDDRLANILSRLSDLLLWDAFEGALNQKLLRVYALKSDCVRHDSTTSSSFRLVEGEDGALFQFGHSKDHRPDLPQLKIMLATLDPFGLPLATEVVAGNTADDPLYIPSIERVQQSVERRGLLHVGDSKMSALATRGFIVRSGDHYLCPLSKKQFSDEALHAYLDPIRAGKHPLETIDRKDVEGTTHPIAEGFECAQECSVQVNGQIQTWLERHLVIRSFQHARSAEQALEKRMEKAQIALLALNQRGRGKRRPQERSTLDKKITDILQRYRVETLLNIRLEECAQQQSLRPYKDRPATIKQTWDFQLQVTVNEAAVEKTRAHLGWKVYATSTTQEQFSLGEAVLCYRNEYRIEHSFKRLKGPLSLKPMYLQRDDRVQGLVHLLSIALRVLTLIECTLRQQLEARQESLQGLYPGQPKKTTLRPTTERILRAFKGIYLNTVEQKDQVLCHVNELSDLQLHILRLLNLPSSIYYQLAGHSSKPP